MITRTVMINNRTGLHARPASMFVRTASKYESKVSIFFQDKKINAKSMMAILSAGICFGNNIDISAEGIDEIQAIDELVDLIENEFGE